MVDWGATSEGVQAQAHGVRAEREVLPIENMDGRTLWEGGELCQRKTHSQVDLNRNYDFAWKKLVGVSRSKSPSP